MEKAPFVILILQRPEFCVLCIQTYVDSVGCFFYFKDKQCWVLMSIEWVIIYGKVIEH